MSNSLIKWNGIVTLRFEDGHEIRREYESPILGITHNGKRYIRYSFRNGKNGKDPSKEFVMSVRYGCSL